MSQNASGSGPDLDACFAVAFEAAVAAGRIIRSKISESQLDVSTTKINHADIVTEVDKECEEVIKSLLTSKFANFEMVAEESANGKEARTNELAVKTPVWCIDPIDGTTNFFHGLPFVAVCIGLRWKRDSVLGIVLNPILCEMFFSIKGRGSYLLDIAGLMAPQQSQQANKQVSQDFYSFNGAVKSSRRLKTSGLRFVPSEAEAEVIAASLKDNKDNKDLAPVETSVGLRKALVLTEVGYDRSKGWVNAVMKRLDIMLLDEKVRGIRMLGSCALNMCFIASGRAHIFFEGCNKTFGPKPWDYTAAEVIVLEAGGCLFLPESVSNADGVKKPVEWDCTRGRILCCNNMSAVEAILELDVYLPEECLEENEKGAENEQKE